MNLISCESCGVVLDASKLRFPSEYERPDGGAIEGKGAWDDQSYQYKPIVNCPVCGAEILQP